MEGKAPAFKNSKAETNTRVKRSVSAILTYLDVFYRLLMCCSVYLNWWSFRPKDLDFYTLANGSDLAGDLEFSQLESEI